jgi:hypothetical protein
MNACMVTPAFCPAEQLRGMLQRLRRLRTSNIPHFILLNHWPINEARNIEDCKALAEEYGCIPYDSGADLGLTGSLNFWLDGHADFDMMIGFDADSDIDHPGFDQAFIDVMAAKPDLGMCAIKNDIITSLSMHKLSAPMDIAGHHLCCLHYGQVEMWNVSAYDLNWLRVAGKFFQTYAYYGGIESGLHGKAMRDGKAFGYLMDWCELWRPIPCSEETARQLGLYQAWKREHIAGDGSSFKAWLSARALL